MYRRVFLIIFTVSFLYSLSGGRVLAGQETVSHEFTAIEWSFQGKPIPETHWSPWLPLGAQEIVRLKLGFRFSEGTIAGKCPVKLTFTYDADKAKSGEDLAIKVKAEMMSADYDTFESAFGISLPNKIQLGLFGVSGLPDFLPWWDIPYDFWDLVSYVPKVGDSIASAEDNIGVNTSTQDALPLGSTDSYHDQRTLISVDMSDLAEEYKDTISPIMYNKLSSFLGSDGMDELLTIIRLTKGVDNDGAVEFLTDLCGDAVEKLSSFASISLGGDPYFSVEGIRLRVNARCFIPGGKGSGDYVLYFTSSGQEQTINFRDITPFVVEGDVLKVVVDSITYEFKLRQGLTAEAGISVATVDLDNVEKVVSYVQAPKNYTESEYKLEIPLEPSDELIQGLRANPGCVSASVNWASPTMPVKGTVKAYKGTSLVKTVRESTFKNAHNVIVTGLEKSMTYRFDVECATTDGQKTPIQSVETTTKDKYEPREERTSIKATDQYEAFNLTNASVTADRDWLEFSWTTDQLSDTEVLISPAPDLSLNYVACIKKRNGTVVQGWVTRGGDAELTNNHKIKVTGLEPGTKYYYNIKSWQFDNDDVTGNPKFAVGKLGDVSTLAIPEPPTVKVKVMYQDTAVPDIPVVVTKGGDSSYRVVVRSGKNGLTGAITLEKNKGYRFSISDNLYYQDVTSNPLNVSNTATGALADFTLDLTAKPSPGGYVYDSQGNPLAGAAVKIVGKSGYQTTTDSTGHYTFDGFSFTGRVKVEISKQNYVMKTVPGKVETLSKVKVFSAENCILDSALAGLNLTVKKNNGAAISNANVIIKEGPTPIGQTLKTNSQGKATFSNNFNDNNAKFHNLTILVQPAVTSGLVAVTTTVSVIGGSTQDVEINCPQDTSGPVIGNLTVTQQNNLANINFATTEDGSFNVIYKEPGSNTEKETVGAAFVKSGDIYTAYRGISFGKEGVYKIKVKATDRAGNISESDWVELMFYTRAFTFSISKTTNSMTFSWSRPWLDAEQFAKYVLTIEKPSKNIEITDRMTTSYKLTGLSSNQLICGTFKILSKSGTTLYQFNSGSGSTPNRFSIKTDSVGTQVSNFSANPNPANIGEVIKSYAKIIDPDKAVQKIKLTAVKKVDKNDKAPEPIMTYEQDINYSNSDKGDTEFEHDFEISEPDTYTLTITGLNYRNVEVFSESVELVVSEPKD